MSLPPVVAGVVLVRASRTATRRLGSAPWSPLPLTVEVMPQMMASPVCLSTKPVMLRRPSVAGAQGRLVEALLPVG